MQKKFVIKWINDPGIDLDYYEIWNEDDLWEDFKGDHEFLKMLSRVKIHKSFIHFDCEGHLMVITRVSSEVETTI